MIVRRKEILQELRLTPLWCKREKQLESNVTKTSNLSITKESDRNFLILQSDPCVGPAGKLLDNMLKAISLERGHNVYITNLASYKELDYDGVPQCEPFLARQIELIRPSIIIALGMVVAQSLLNTVASFDSLRGKLHEYSGIPLIVTYHPSHLLEMQPDKEKVWKDLCFAKYIIKN
tara:strand:- start:3318 stop:3848 length:531 start_codon:yes stop_codon:yes gene_type:complete